MDEEEIYEYWSESNGYVRTKVHHLGYSWNVKAAKKVLNTWQREFVKVRYVSSIIDIHCSFITGQGF
jgi:hypothetical protein